VYSLSRASAEFYQITGPLGVYRQGRQPLAAWPSLGAALVYPTVPGWQAP